MSLWASSTASVRKPRRFLSGTPEAGTLAAGTGALVLEAWAVEVKVVRKAGALETEAQEALEGEMAREKEAGTLEVVAPEREAATGGGVTFRLRTTADSPSSDSHPTSGSGETISVILCLSILLIFYDTFHYVAIFI